MKLTLFDRIETGTDWLEHPDLQGFLQRQQLDDVRVQQVGARRTFSGKAWPAHSLVRLVTDGVHPVRWLLTLIHELAHIADYRQRIADLERQWGRPYRPGRHDARAAWRLERPHGQRWRHQFVRLAQAAIEDGLFPGNEMAVLAAAQEGMTTLDDVELDLLADPRVQAEHLRELDEQQRQRIAEARERTAQFRREFRPGHIVHFDGGPRRGFITGQLVRINRKTSTVQALGTNWLVPHGFLRPGSAPPDAPAPRLRPAPRDRFSRGEEVYFRHKGQRLEGHVIRVNQKTCTVETAEGRWRVAFGMLKPLRR